MTRQLGLLTTLLFSASLFFTTQLSGQVIAPELLCVANDTINWITPINSCGTFNGYLVYGSQSEDGPFNVIATISDPQQTDFFNPNASGQTWYYYLESDFDCPGETVLQSDTINNQIPEPASIESISVENNEVELSWTESPSPEVTVYSIYRETTSGTTLIDTVMNRTSFTDNSGSPDQQAEEYYVLASDPCGNSSIFINPHKTIYLEAAPADPCTQSIDLSWSAYQGWEEGVTNYEVWFSVNGGAPVLAETLAGDVLSYTFSNLNDMETYCFFIRANQDFLGVSSSSNETCQEVDVIQPAGEVVITNISVNAEDLVELSWTWDPNSELAQYFINQSDDGSSFGSIFSESAVSNLQSSNTYLDDTALPGARPVYYQIEAVDLCDSVSTSNIVSSIYLQVETNQSGEYELQWTNFNNDLAELTTYEVYRVVDGSETLVGMVDPFQASYLDDFSAAETGVTEACYYVVAIANVWVNGQKVAVQSRSNLACGVQRSKIYVPNAFVPDGINNEFKPILEFGVPQTYILQVFDRWGGQVFESTSLDTGWDGRKNDTELPQGVYAFYIKVTQADGSVQEKSGTILLLR